MNRRVLLDTGPLVALLNGRDQHHEWAKLQWSQAAPPLLTCEPVLSEACFLLRIAPGGSAAVMELLRRRVVEVAFHLEDHLEAVARLLRKYADVPMSLADGCLVRMAELSPESAVLTLDRHFRLYRKSGRRVVPAIMPGESTS
jgi:predicted nucleic acid-binding protein